MLTISVKSSPIETSIVDVSSNNPNMKKFPPKYEKRKLNKNPSFSVFVKGEETLKITKALRERQVRQQITVYRWNVA